MPLSSFHPVLARWFRDTLGMPTTVQADGWAAIRARRPTLISAPTGSGKTLAAFFVALDELFLEGLERPLSDEVRVLYVSPLKALSADIHKNLAEPRSGIRRLARDLGADAPRITAAVRTGDTPQAERAAMLRTPPHILVTTPESFYLLLTAERSRQMLRTVRTVIVDEIHAVIGTRRGAHLALSLERLEQVTDRPPLRLGLSATQRPVEEVARFLVGTGRPIADIVNAGHRRAMDLDLELPGSPLEAVMSHEVWAEYYDRLAALIRSHRTTLVFVNTRRLAERVTRHLAERLGEDVVTAHHGSLSKETRLDAEDRLKTGRLKALVATASLELGIDIGHVDLVCQVGSPRLISTFLQRVGRSGHTIAGLPKGRLLPLSRDELVECAALVGAVRHGELDRLIPCGPAFDVLAQQIVAETACREYTEDELFAVARRAYPYRDLARTDFDRILRMLADGFATRRGRRAALIHRDEVRARVRARRAARLTAITCGGAIPETADYRVLAEPTETFIGTLNEDFAIESMAGDVFQLGNSSWRVLQVASGTVRVEDAKGAPPNIPFWLGEAPGRSDELSRAVSDLREEVDRRVEEAMPRAGAEPEQAALDVGAGLPPSHEASADRRSLGGGGQPGSNPAIDWLVSECGVPHAAADQIAAYLAAARQALGVMPSQRTLVLERFFDESGGMQLVLHAPFGTRVNRAWGLALRKRFCRQFNFELQAAATEEGLLLSLGPQHSFPLADVFRYLHAAGVRDLLVQALLDAPMFETRWRWNTTVALAVPRNRNGRKVPPPLQRMLAGDLLTAVFPDAAACLENVPGDREIPDHPLVEQTIHDCLHDAMDLAALERILADVHAGRITCVARDTTEPSPLSHEIVNARPYGFLDDAPLEERRTMAVQTRRALDPATAADLGALDASAIARVVEDARPEARDADELHDALLSIGFLTEAEIASEPAWPGLLAELADTGRATWLTVGSQTYSVAAERLPEALAAWGARVGSMRPAISAPSSRAREWAAEAATIELLRGRLAVAGPVTVGRLVELAALDTPAVEAALAALEHEGAVLRGSFTPGARDVEWCDRRLLARIHRATLTRLRAEIEPVTAADFMRFLFAWQHVDPDRRLTGPDGLRAIVEQLDGYELPAAAWERHVLPARIDRYEPSMLDLLCLTGQTGWGRLSAPARQDEGIQLTDTGFEVRGFTPVDPAVSSRPLGTSPTALFLRSSRPAWLALAPRVDLDAVSEPARQVAEALARRGAMFFGELSALTGLDAEALERVLAELVSIGAVTSDGFAGLRALMAPRDERGLRGLEQGGRWTLAREMAADEPRAAAVERQARALLKRYGVVFRRLLAREDSAAPWRELALVYRRLEARGEIRGGRFVAGMSGEQFALAEAVAELRAVRRTPPSGRPIVISGADPLNLAGIVTPGQRVPAIGPTRVVWRDGVPLEVAPHDATASLAVVGVGLQL